MTLQDPDRAEGSFNSLIFGLLDLWRSVEMAATDAQQPWEKHGDYVPRGLDVESRYLEYYCTRTLPTTNLQ